MRKHNKNNWSEYDEGFSVGTSGDGGGAIVRDEDHKNGARITMEEENGLAEFVITCGVYGWMFHTRLFDGRAEADEAFDEMREELGEILEAKPSEESAGEEEQEDFAEELVMFIERFP
ncbi:MAG: hypothetical protein M3T96_04975 [Acidobacteriota bacterium]|nr:hypothetical protein [Acidobacteriota bacterium]